jgi:hypothetical protein
MTYERFLDIITTLKSQDELMSELYDKRIDLIEFADPYHKAISELIAEVYGEEGLDWWNWFCYEAEYGQKSFGPGAGPVYIKTQDGGIELLPESDIPEWGAIDENGNPICYSFESLWEYLEANKPRAND